MPPKKKNKKPTALTKYDAIFAQEAQRAADIEKNMGGGNFISLKNGRMTYRGAEVPDNKMNVIIMDFILENDFFDGPYDPDNPTSPACYALGRDQDTLAPHENSASPQSKACTGCLRNEWGTGGGLNGNGKACKNVRRLALITEGDYTKDISRAEVSYLRLPVTSVRAWNGYVHQLNNVLKKPPFAVTTEIAVIPDQRSQFKVQFDMIATIDDPEAMAALFKLHERVEKEIMIPYPQTPPEPPKGRPAVRRK
jgi:hypothetical protein